MRACAAGAAFGSTDQFIAAGEAERGVQTSAPFLSAGLLAKEGRRERENVVKDLRAGA